MGDKDLDAFIRLVIDDDSLQTELRETSDRRAFVERVVELGLKSGFDFSSASVEEAMRANRQKWLKT